MKNQKGFTLIEVLAVVVLLGVLSSIAVPAMADVIEDNKKDSYVQTARQMIESARFASLINDDIDDNNDSKISLSELITNGYVGKPVKDPWNDTYQETNSYVSVDTNGVYSVYLESTDGTNPTHVVATAFSSGSAIQEASLSKDSVKAKSN